MTDVRDNSLSSTEPQLWQGEPGSARRPDSRPVTVIEARPDKLLARLKSLWQYRGFYGFLFKEITMRRARGTLLGFWWLILRPLIPAIGFMVTFAVVVPLPTGSRLPYSIFFLTGFIPWRVFQGTVTLLPRSLTWVRGIMQRTYFPRLLVPLSAFGPILIELGILSVVLAVVVVRASWGSNDPVPLRFGWETLWLVPCLLGALMFGTAFGMVLSVVALFFRDIIFSVTYFARLAMFLTPVVAPVTVIPEAYRWLLYVLNPMAQIVMVTRWALTGEGQFETGFVALAFAMIAAAFAASVVFFLRAEAQLGDQL